MIIENLLGTQRQRGKCMGSDAHLSVPCLHPDDPLSMILITMLIVTPRFGRLLLFPFLFSKSSHEKEGEEQRQFVFFCFEIISDHVCTFQELSMFCLSCA